MFIYSTMVSTKAKYVLSWTGSAWKWSVDIPGEGVYSGTWSGELGFGGTGMGANPNVPFQANATTGNSFIDTSKVMPGDILTAQFCDTSTSPPTKVMYLLIMFDSNTTALLEIIEGVPEFGNLESSEDICFSIRNACTFHSIVGIPNNPIITSPVAGYITSNGDWRVNFTNYRVPRWNRCSILNDLTILNCSNLDNWNDQLKLFTQIVTLSQR